MSLRRPYTLSFVRTQSPTDDELIPGGSLTVVVYRQGATATTTVDVSATVPTAVPVDYVGRIQPGDVLQRGVLGTDLFICTGIPTPTAVTMQAVGGDKTVLSGDRFIPTTRPTLYRHPYGDEELPNPLLSDAGGLVQFYAYERFLDYTVSGPIAPYLAINEPGGQADDRLNALEFGAKGDNSTDDTAALNQLFYAAALLGPASGLGKVFLPRGVYRISDSVTVDGGFTTPGQGYNIDVEGEEGTIILAIGSAWTGAAAMFKFAAQTAAHAGIAIRNITFDGNSLGGGVSAFDLCGIRTHYQQNVTIENCAFQNFGSAGTFDADPNDGINIGGFVGAGTRAGCVDLTVRNCRFTNCDGVGIRLHDIEHAVLDDLTFGDCRYSAILGERQVATLTTQDLRDIHLSHIRIDDCGTGIASIHFGDLVATAYLPDQVEGLYFDDVIIHTTSQQTVGLTIVGVQTVHINNTTIDGGVSALGAYIVATNAKIDIALRDMTNAGLTDALQITSTAWLSSENVDLRIRCQNIGTECVLADYYTGTLQGTFYLWGSVAASSAIDVTGDRIAITGSSFYTIVPADVAIAFAAGSANCIESGNVIIGCTTPITDAGSGNIHGDSKIQAGASLLWNTLTLTNPGVGTVVTNPQVLGANTRIVFSSASAAAAANIAAMYVSAVAAGTFTITHANVAAQTIHYAVLN